MGKRDARSAAKSVDIRVRKDHDGSTRRPPQGVVAKRRETRGTVARGRPTADLAFSLSAPAVVRGRPARRVDTGESASLQQTVAGFQCLVIACLTLQPFTDAMA